MSTQRTIIVLLALVALASAQDSYVIEEIPHPDGEVVEVGGMDWLSDGRLVVSTRRGRVWIVEGLDGDPQETRWTLFADGLHEGLGLSVLDGQIHVVQRGEVTVLEDSNGDGVADVFTTKNEAWGVSSNYHEFAYGLPRDAAGNLYVSLNLAFLNPKWWHGQAQVPFRGCVLRLNGRKSEPFAFGFRSPNGIGLDPKGRLFVTDNQGDWMPVCPVFHVKEGGFYGHPASLRWTDEYQQTGRLPSDTVPPAWERAPAALWVPYDLSRSTAGMTWDRTNNRFGPFDQQMFLAELTNGRLLRADLEEVNGVMQGACFRFLDGVGCANRVTFSPKGALIVGLTERGWGGRGRPFGLTRVRYTGVSPFEIQHVALEEAGFLLRFTEPLAAAPTTGAITVSDYDYSWWWQYGSPEQRQEERPVTNVTLSDDGRELRLGISGLRAGRVVRVVLNDVASKSGKPLRVQRFDYTLNRMPGGPTIVEHVVKEVPPPPTKEEEQENWLHISDGWSLSAWQGRGWQIAGLGPLLPGARRYALTRGADAYVNVPETEGGCEDLTWSFEHGDIEAEWQFALPAGNATGVAFQGRYVVSFTQEDTPREGPTTLSDTGAVPASDGFLGAKPRVRVPGEPGQWRNVRVVFEAPRFDASGRRTAPARFAEVRLDDKVLHRNLVLEPNRGDGPEAAFGPMVLSGGPGQVVVRGFKIRTKVRHPAASATVLLDESLSRFRPMGKARWQGAVDAVECVGEGALLTDALDYQDVDVTCRVFFDSAAEAAIILRAQTRDDGPEGYQIVINHDGPGKERTGSITGLAPLLTTLCRPATWTDLALRCTETDKGTRVQVWLSGVLINDFLDPERRFPRGAIALENATAGKRFAVKELRIARR